MNRFLGLLVLGVLSIMTACYSDTKIVVSKEDGIALERIVESLVKRLKNTEIIAERDVCGSISNAVVLANIRKNVGAYYGVIPIYCFLSDSEQTRRVSESARDTFDIQVVGFGDRDAWNEMEKIWLIVMRNVADAENCEVLASSLRNLTRSYGSLYSSHNHFGRYSYRQLDPYFGFDVCDIKWKSEVARSHVSMYLLLDSGAALGLRHGRSVYPVKEWNSRVAQLKKRGVIVEMIPILDSNDKCLLECR